MTQPISVAVVGCSGRMGQMLIRAVDERDDCQLIGVTERAGHDWIGGDLGEAMGGAARGLAVSDDPLEVFATGAGGARFHIAGADRRSRGAGRAGASWST